MRILSIDQHISVNADLRNIWNRLGHTVHEISLSGHAPVIGRPVGHVPMLAGDGWCATIHGRKFKEFYEAYRSELDNFDAFLCCYPPIFSMLYRDFKKPIILHIPIRYECGADNNPELWLEFNEYLRSGFDSGMIILAANSMYDKKYAEGFIQRPVEYIPSLCEYTGMTYNPVYSQFLYYASFDVADPSGRMIKKHAALKAGHAWQTIADFSGAVHYPYNSSTMSVFEQYAAGMPIFFPTKRYLLEMFLSGVPVLDQISWRCQGGKSTNSIIPHIHEYDPNNYRDFNVLSHWLDYADYYYGDMKHIVRFDSIDERNDILGWSQSRLMNQSNLIRADHAERRARVYAKWEKVLGGIGA